MSSKAVVAHEFNPNTQEAEICEFHATLVYRESSRIARGLGLGLGLGADVEA